MAILPICRTFAGAVTIRGPGAFTIPGSVSDEGVIVVASYGGAASPHPVRAGADDGSGATAPSPADGHRARGLDDLPAPPLRDRHPRGPRPRRARVRGRARAGRVVAAPARSRGYPRDADPSRRPSSTTEGTARPHRVRLERHAADTLFRSVNASPQRDGRAGVPRTRAAAERLRAHRGRPRRSPRRPAGRRTSWHAACFGRPLEALTEAADASRQRRVRQPDRSRQESRVLRSPPSALSRDRGPP